MSATSTTKTSSTMMGPDAIAMLEEQHRAVEELFQLLRDTGGRHMLVELADTLDGHTMIEEEHFYPALRAADPDGLVDRAYDDHAEVKHALLEVLQLDPTDDSYPGMVEELEGLVASHVEDEETEIFARARELLSPDELLHLGRVMQVTLLERQGARELRERFSDPDVTLTP